MEKTKLVEYVIDRSHRNPVCNYFNRIVGSEDCRKCKFFRDINIERTEDKESIYFDNVFGVVECANLKQSTSYVS